MSSHVNNQLIYFSSLKRRLIALTTLKLIFNENLCMKIVDIFSKISVMLKLARRFFHKKTVWSFSGMLPALRVTSSFRCAFNGVAEIRRFSAETCGNLRTTSETVPWFSLFDLCLRRRVYGFYYNVTLYGRCGRNFGQPCAIARLYVNYTVVCRCARNARVSAVLSGRRGGWSRISEVPRSPPIAAGVGYINQITFDRQYNARRVTVAAV